MDRDGDWDGVTVSGFVAPGDGRPTDGARCQAARACAGALAARARRRRWRCVMATFRPRRSVANALVAQNGVQATILAKHGMTGPLDLFENRHGLKSVFPGIDGWTRSPRRCRPTATS